MTEFTLQSFKTMVEQAQDLHLVLSPFLLHLCPGETAGKVRVWQGPFITSAFTAAQCLVPC